MKKYELTEDTIVFKKRTLYRIKRLSDGLLGGYIESENNLSQNGSCFVYDRAKVFGKAKILDDAKIRDCAIVFGSAVISKSASIEGSSMAFHNAAIAGAAKISGNVRVYGNATARGCSTVKDDVHLCGDSVVEDQATVLNSSCISGKVRIFGSVVVLGESWIGYTDECKNSRIYGTKHFGHRPRNLSIFEGKSRPLVQGEDKISTAISDAEWWHRLRNQAIRQVEEEKNKAVTVEAVQRKSEEELIKEATRMADQLFDGDDNCGVVFEETV